MNELDYVLLFVILVGIVVGLRRGLIRLLISILGIYFTVLIVGYAYEPIGRTLNGGVAELLGSPPGLTAMYNLSYLILLLFLIMVLELISRAAFEDTSLTSLRGLDNLLGGLVGIAYGALWASLLLVPIQFGVARTGGAWADAVRQSQLVPTLNQFFGNAVLDVLGLFFLDGTPLLYRPTFLIQ